MKSIFRIIILSILLSSCEKDLKWNLVAKPEIGNPIIVDNSLYKIKTRVECSFNGNDDNTEFGICWSYNSNPTIDDKFIKYSNGSEGIFDFEINWDGNATYFLRSYAKNQLGVFYSDTTLTLNWGGGQQNLPILSSLKVSNVFFNNARIQAEVNDGGIALSDRGFCISTQYNLDINNSDFIVHTVGPNYRMDSLCGGLQDGITYYVKAYAVNLAGIAYSDTLSFTTKKFYNVGEIGPAGGYIFYYKADSIGGWNYLEAAATDATSKKWSNNLSITGVQDSSIGSGYQNTISLTSNFNNIAALTCSGFYSNGYQDWFLPSRDELILAKNILFDNNLGNFQSNEFYWTSTEDKYFALWNAWVVEMKVNNWNIISYDKKTIFKIRPIRRF